MITKKTRITAFVAAVLLMLGSFSACKSAGDDLAADGAAAYGEKKYAEALTLLESADAEGLSKYKQYELDLMLADCYLKTGNLDKAVEFCDRVINETKTSGHYRAYNIKGIALKQSGDYKAALESYEKALEFDENNKDSVALYNNIAVVLISLVRPLEAKEYLEKAINLDPSFAEAYGNLAVAYAALFDFDSAEAALADAKTVGYDKVDEVQAIIDKYRGFEDFKPEE
jgi:tetratricopeptide (TPR) repeat protein